jgi:hypothetical protein
VTGYSNPDVYPAVVDLDNDGLPELIIPEKQSHYEFDPNVPDCISGLTLDPLASEQRKEWDRIVGRFDSFNFKYGVDWYAVPNLSVMDSVQILTLAGSTRVVTGRFRDHLKWRMTTLERVRQVLDSRCKDRIDSVLSYLSAQ